MKNHLLPLLFILLLFNGCSKDESNPLISNTENIYYPLKVGNQWIYSQSNAPDQTLLCSSSTVIDGNTIYGFTGDDDYYWNFDQEQNGEGLFYKDGDLWGRKNGTIKMFLSNNPVVGDVYIVNSWDSCRIKILSISETIAVEAGTFECIKFSFDYDALTPDVYWLAKNVGIVQIRQESGSYFNECKLKSYSLK